MSPIPNSNLRGHKRLHDRVVRALETCQELQSVDFKESATWGDLKWRIICTAMGMGNLRDGGVVVIGVSERNEKWTLTGITNDHLATFDTDDMIDVINKYVSPPMEPDVVFVEHDGQTYLAIQFEEFVKTPFVCRKNSPDSIKKRFYESNIFIRPPGKPQTKRVMNAAEMDDLLELAGEKRARKIIETVRRIGLSPSEPSVHNFDNELEGL